MGGSGTAGGLGGCMPGKANKQSPTESISITEQSPEGPLSWEPQRVPSAMQLVPLSFRHRRAPFDDVRDKLSPLSCSTGICFDRELHSGNVRFCSSFSELPSLRVAEACAPQHSRPADRRDGDRS